MIKKIYAIVFAFTSLTLYSQKSKHLRLYADFGVQFNNSESSFNSSLPSNYSPFQIGAGSSYKLGFFLIGTEFYTSKNKLNDEIYKSDYREFTSTIFLGFDLLRSTNFAIEPSIGLSMTNKSLILYNFQDISTQSFNTEQLGISPRISFTKFSRKNTSIGLKLGFNYALNNYDWNNGIDKSKTNYSVNRLTPFLQLSFGGKINLSKKTKS